MSYTIQADGRTKTIRFYPRSQNGASFSGEAFTLSLQGTDCGSLGATTTGSDNLGAFAEAVYTAPSSVPTGSCSIVARGDDTGRTCSCPLTLTAASAVNCCPAVTTIALGPLIEGTALSGSISASPSRGSGQVTFTEISMPAGLSISSSGVLSGTLPAAGSYTLSIEMDDGFTLCETDIDIEITEAVVTDPCPVVTGIVLPDLIPGASFTGSIEAISDNGTVRFSRVSFPSGINIDSSGSFSGTVPAAGLYQIVVGLADDVATCSVNITLRVIEPGEGIPADYNDLLASYQQWQSQVSANGTINEFQAWIALQPDCTDPDDLAPLRAVYQVWRAQVDTSGTISDFSAWVSRQPECTDPVDLAPLRQIYQSWRAQVNANGSISQFSTWVSDQPDCDECPEIPSDYGLLLSVYTSWQSQVGNGTIPDFGSWVARQPDCPDCEECPECEEFPECPEGEVPDDYHALKGAFEHWHQQTKCPPTIAEFIAWISKQPDCPKAECEPIDFVVALICNKKIADVQYWASPQMPAHIRVSRATRDQLIANGEAIILPVNGVLPQ